jgi:GNAT superfamily N-acetyltransferase
MWCEDAHPDRSGMEEMQGNDVLVGAGEVTIGWYDADRRALRPLFEEAEDSESQLDAYIDEGTVLVAELGGEPVGHLQLVGTTRPHEVELKNMAVIGSLRGTGIGRRLVEEAVDASRAEGYPRMVVATAAADIDNLRFYQRRGFRFHGVEQDAFGPDSGYPEPVMIDGIPLRDRIWFTLDL